MCIRDRSNVVYLSYKWLGTINKFNIMDFASQASIVRKFQNVKIQLHKVCLRNNVIPNCARINMKGTSIADVRTIKHAEIYRIKEEIKALYGKKSLLNSNYTIYICSY